VADGLTFCIRNSKKSAVLYSKSHKEGTMELQEFNAIREKLGSEVAILMALEGGQSVSFLCARLHSEPDVLVTFFRIAREHENVAAAQEVLDYVLNELPSYLRRIRVLEQILPLFTWEEANTVFEHLYYNNRNDTSVNLSLIVLMQRVAHEIARREEREKKKDCLSGLIEKRIRTRKDACANLASMEKDVPWYRNFDRCLRVWLCSKQGSVTPDLLTEAVRVYSEGHALEGYYVHTQEVAQKMLQNILSSSSHLDRTPPAWLTPQFLRQLHEACKARHLEPKTKRGNTIIEYLLAHKDAAYDDFVWAMNKATGQEFWSLRERIAITMLAEDRVELNYFLRTLTPKGVERELHEMQLGGSRHWARACTLRTLIFNHQLMRANTPEKVIALHDAVEGMYPKSDELEALRADMFARLLLKAKQVLRGDPKWLIAYHEMLKGDEKEQKKVRARIKQSKRFREDPVEVCKESLGPIFFRSMTAIQRSWHMTKPGPLPGLLVSAALAKVKTTEEAIDLMPPIESERQKEVESEYVMRFAPVWMKHLVCERALALAASDEDLKAIHFAFYNYFSTKLGNDHVLEAEAKAHYAYYLRLSVEYAKDAEELLAIRKRALHHGFTDILNAVKRKLAALVAEAMAEPEVPESAEVASGDQAASAAEE
jgi:hypothetical protein